jgi:adenosylcobinamide kinase/adenosylcobinamide-phosphate guanylyltransferase
MSERRLVLIGGGVRSGKSAFALRRACELGARRVFIATAQAFDGEMQTRIERHVEERGDEFDTIEEPLELAEVLSELESDTEVVVVDCLTLWLSNLLLQDRSEPQIADAIDRLVTVLEARRTHVVIVTNEVGMGVVPESRLGRVFRDVSGLAHQRLSAIADEIYAGMLGCMLRLHPAPLQVERAVPRSAGGRG